jgi:hypothetical protein
MLLAEEERARSHETYHRYSLEEFGLKSDEIHTALADLFDRYGWEEEPRRGPRTQGEERHAE